MSYVVLARKWRPQTFDEVAGQETVTRALRNALRSGRIAHAFLFSGVRGVGKTTTARILAKALNCEKGPTEEPCSRCVSCTEIAAANSLDVLEIDAASNTGVDNIRELRESARYTPARDRFKIYIIDEVHMLSNAAFNALLKTLEEPPPHVKFILATTEHAKIPVTITSRCQEYDLKPIPFVLILEHLKRICASEEIEISDYGLRAISSAAKGSMRDGQSILEQITSLSGKQVSDEDVRVLLGVVDEKLVAGLVDCIQERDAQALLQRMQDAVESGVDPLNLAGRMLAHVRNLMVFQVSGWEERLLQLPDSQKEVVTRQAEAFSTPDLIRFFDVLTRCGGEMRWHPNPGLHLEMAFMKLIELAGLPRLESVLEQLESGRFQGTARTPENPPESRDLFGSRPAPSGPAPAAKTTAAPAPAASPAPPEPARSEPVQQAQGFRERLLAAVQDQAGLYNSLLHSSDSQVQDGDLIVVFPASEQVHAGLVQEKAQHLAELSGQLTGSPCKLQIRFQEAEPSGKDEEEDLAEHPKVKAFLKRFPSKVIVERNP
ncbi:MAG: DNA polymerase III subunit gamma/tau [Acidobacteriota bacterium]|nr:DNA polymerase III subunit gamma/tau [Acidobacteriota bacterium]